MRSIIAIDTEFARVTSYYPKLSIIQYKFKTSKPEIIDVLNIQKEDEYIIGLLFNPNVKKIIHSGRQDIEAIRHKFGFTMSNIFDTQIAAKYLGFGNEIGYAALVEKVCNVKIEKSKKLQFSKWLKRPLNDEQIEYAKQDVQYLFDIYHKQSALLTLKENAYSNELFNDAIARLEDDSLYAFNPLCSWHERTYRHFDYEKRDKLKQLFMLREKIAHKMNIAKNRILKNDDLVALLEGDLTSIDSMQSSIDKKEFLKIIS